MKVYTYKQCGTCRKAVQWLKSKGVQFDEIPIRETPPTIAELEQMLTAYHGDLKKLFNTSGNDYRSLEIKDKLASMTQSEALKLLNSNGNLVKRPFLLDSKWMTVGFNENGWNQHLGS